MNMSCILYSPYKMENVIKYVANELEIDVVYTENATSNAPKKAT